MLPPRRPSDEDISSAVKPVATLSSTPSGSMTRARMRQINGQVLSLIYTYDLADENMILRSYSDLLVLRNEGVKDLTRESNIKPGDGKCCTLTTPAGALLHARTNRTIYAPCYVRAKGEKEEATYTQAHLIK